ERRGACGVFFCFSWWERLVFLNGCRPQGVSGEAAQSSSARRGGGGGGAPPCLWLVPPPPPAGRGEEPPWQRGAAPAVLWRARGASLGFWDRRRDESEAASIWRLVCWRMERE